MIPVHFASLSDGDGADLDVPEELHKGASLTAELELSVDGITPVRRAIATDHDDLTLFWDFDRPHAHSHTEVLDRTLRAAAVEIAAVVQAQLMPEKALGGSGSDR